MPAAAAASQCPGAATSAGRAASPGCPAAPTRVTACTAAAAPVAVGACRVIEDRHGLCRGGPSVGGLGAMSGPPCSIGGYLTISEVVAARQLFVSLDSAMPALESAQASRK